MCYFLRLFIKEQELDLKRVEAADHHALEMAKLSEAKSARRDGMAEQGLRNSDEQAEDRAIAAQAINVASEGQREMAGALVAAMTAPKRIVRDKQGRPVGVETILDS